MDADRQAEGGDFLDADRNACRRDPGLDDEYFGIDELEPQRRKCSAWRWSAVSIRPQQLNALGAAILFIKEPRL